MESSPAATALSPRHTELSKAQRMGRGMQGLAAIAFFALITTVIARYTGYTLPTIPPSPIVETRQLLFTDLQRGVIEINDGASGDLLMRIETGEQAFLRSVVRGLARQRRAISGLRDVGVPFDLSRLADGRLIIADRISGETIQLDAFGPNNLITFELLLTAGSAPGVAVPVTAEPVVTPYGAL
ncbi:MAG: photosynthetic complex assembly protein PuhC [Pseudomonadota bacterium]